MPLPQPVTALVNKYDGPRIPEMEEAAHDQQDDEAYCIAVLRDLDELDDHLGRPVYRALREHLDKHVDIRVWCIKRRELVQWFLAGQAEVAEALEAKAIDDAFSVLAQNFERY